MTDDIFAFVWDDELEEYAILINGKESDFFVGQVEEDGGERPCIVRRKRKREAGE